MASYRASGSSSWEDCSDDEYKVDDPDDDDDDDDEDIPLRKKPRRFKSTPKNDGKVKKVNNSGDIPRKAGRPPGSKNKQPKNGQKSASTGHKIKKPKKSKSQLNTETLQLNKETLQKINVDDNENVVAIVGQNEVDLNVSTLNPGTNCGSPVKANPRQESRKKVRRPETWYKFTKIKAKNDGVEYVSKNIHKEKEIRRARRVGPPCKCRLKCYDMIGMENVKGLHDG